MLDLWKHLGQRARRVGVWMCRLGIAPPLLLLSFALPVPQNNVIAGLPSLCPFHNLTGLPCPGCGLTRSVVCCAHGLWHEAAAYHPLGPVMFVGLIGVALAGAVGAFYPRWHLKYSAPVFKWALCFGALALGGIWVARLCGVLPPPP